MMINTQFMIPAWQSFAPGICIPVPIQPVFFFNQPTAYFNVPESCWVKPVGEVGNMPSLNCLSAQSFEADINKYCFCNSESEKDPISQIEQNDEALKNLLTSEKEGEVCETQDDIEESSPRMIQIRTSEKNINYLEMLKEYDFVSEFRSNPKTGKFFIVYVCKHDDCNKEFLRTWNLLDHARMHRGIKPYECEVCSKKFTQKCNLKKHIEQHNNPSVQSRRKFQCKICDSKFTERYNYKVGC